jgi:hypothetical protein
VVMVALILVWPFTLGRMAIKRKENNRNFEDFIVFI